MARLIVVDLDVVDASKADARMAIAIVRISAEGSAP